MATMNGLWHIQLFGGICAQQTTPQGERRVNRFRTQSTAALLAYLAYFKGHCHSREVLIERMWPDVAVESGRHNLSNALSSLRNQLEPPGVPAGTVIIADRLSIELNPAAFTSDVEVFEQALRHAAQVRTSEIQKAESLARAVEAYTGALLPGYYDAWIRTEQERLILRVRDAARQLVRFHERQGDIEAALIFAHRAVSATAFPDEESSCELIRLLLAHGDSTGALHHYQELERRLKAEWDLEPSATTRALLRQIEEVQHRGSASQRGVIPHSVTAPRTASSGLETSRRSGVQPLPEGTVSFLLVEIRTGISALQSEVTDSSDLLDTRGMEGAVGKSTAMLERYHALLRTTIGQHRGYEANDMGGRQLIAFARASDALRCAIALQKAYTEESALVEMENLPARITLHTGEAIPDAQGNYHGTAVQWAFQIILATNDGQILCSAATAELVRRDQESEATLVDLGLYRLRSLESPERLFMVQYADMTSQAFPPLNVERVHTSNFPASFTRFFGRETEINRLQELFRDPDVRLVTLTGPGGSGKTRLALEAAGRLLDDPSLSRAVWFVPLADLTDPAQIPGAIFDTLGASPREGDSTDPFEATVAILSALAAADAIPMLLVLDNVEHLLLGTGGTGTADKTTDLFARLLEQVPLLTVLATSRQVLGLPGEYDFPVPPLPTPNGGEGGSPERLLSQYDSVRLFADRAQQVKPDFQITNHNAAAVAELVDRLEGIPLAIELAAVRAQMLTPNQMLAMLANRFELLVSRRRGVTERQRTLRATLDWSYTLLDSTLQRFFISLSVFRGGWTVEAAEEVLEEPLALDCLAQLRDSSLILTVEEAGATRFQMLETLREYGREQLDPEAQTTLRRRHAELFSRLAETPPIPVGAEDAGRERAQWFDRERDNLVASLTWALSEQGEVRLAVRLTLCLARHWKRRGNLSEGRRQIAAVLTAYTEITRERAELLRWAGELALMQADFAHSRMCIEQALEHFRSLGMQPEAADMLGELGGIAMVQGDSVAERAYCEEALLQWQELGNAWQTASLLRQLGQNAGQTGDFDRARGLLEESLRLFESLGDILQVGDTHDYLGSVAMHGRDYATARAHFEKAVTSLRPLVTDACRRSLAHALSHLAIPLAHLGDYAAAHQAGAEALILYRELDDKWHLPQGLEHVGRVALLQGEYASARAAHTERLALLRELGNPRYALDALLSLAEVALLTEDPTEAQVLLEESMRLSLGRDEGEERYQLPIILRGLALCDTFQKRFADARQHLVEGLSVMNNQPKDESDLVSLAALIVGFAVLAAHEGQPGRAARLLGAASGQVGISRNVPFEYLQKRLIENLRNALDAGAFAEAYEQGMTLTLNEATNLALRVHST